MESSNRKFGFYEWLMDFKDIESILMTELKAFSVSLSEEKVLVIGCGTSTLSSSVADFGYNSVISIDNDPGCVTHMAEQYASDSRLLWIVHDIVDGELKGDKLRCGNFSAVIDKGTFDAILAEGVVSPMLINVHQLLKPGG